MLGQEKAKVSISLTILLLGTGTNSKMNFCSSLSCVLLPFPSRAQSVQGHTPPGFAGEQFSTRGPAQAVSRWARRSPGGIPVAHSNFFLSF